MKEKYFITEEQLKDLNHFYRMFQVHADEIEELCKNEKYDISYGFQLGKIHSSIRDHFIEMMSLVNEIELQENK